MNWARLIRRVSLATTACWLMVASLQAAPAPSPVNTGAEIGESGGELAHQVRLYGSVKNAEAGHEYRLKAQFRLHTKRGDFGPILTDANSPNGKVIDLSRLSADASTTPQSGAQPGAAPAAPTGTVYLSTALDVTRKDLSTFVNLPPNAASVVIRVEPQVYDVTANKYLTQPKTDAALLVAATGEGGRVHRLQTFGQWFAGQFSDAKLAEAALDLVAELDAWEAGDFDVARGFESLLDSKDLKPEMKARVIAGIPLAVVRGKNNLVGMLRQLSFDPSPLVSAAAKKKFAESF